LLSILGCNFVARSSRAICNCATRSLRFPPLELGKLFERAPVALDRLKAPEPFALRGRKTGNECGPVTPFADDVRCKRDREADCNADRKTCPDHGWIIVPLRGDLVAMVPSEIHLSRS
jgi:hypothetical protein